MQQHWTQRRIDALQFDNWKQNICVRSVYDFLFRGLPLYTHLQIHPRRHMATYIIYMLHEHIINNGSREHLNSKKSSSPSLIDWRRLCKTSAHSTRYSSIKLTGTIFQGTCQINTHIVL